MASIFAPVLYLGVVVGGLGVFSYFYRKRTRLIQLEPYFPSHPERDVYVTLLQQTDPPAFEGLLKAALFCRAMTNMKRVMQLREDKVALQGLLQKGSIGDDLWNSLLQAEKELGAENLEVAHEANEYAPGWGTYIFNSALEMVHNEQTKKLFTDIAAAKTKAQRLYGVSADGSKRKTKSRAIASEPSKPANGKHSDKPKTESAQSQSRLSSPSSQPSSRSVSPSKSNGTLAPPTAGTDGESVASVSDGEHESSARTPSKRPKAKKGKKRK